MAMPVPEMASVACWRGRVAAQRHEPRCPPADTEDIDAWLECYDEQWEQEQ